MDQQEAHRLREAFLAGELSPRSFIGSTPSKPDPATQQRSERERARRQARTEAVLGRASAGSTGDVDAPDAAVEHDVLYEAMELREQIVQSAREAEERGDGWPPEVTAGWLAEVDQWIARAEGDRPAPAKRGGGDGDRRQGAPLDAGNRFVAFLRESGDRLDNDDDLAAWVREGQEAAA